MKSHFYLRTVLFVFLGCLLLISCGGDGRPKTRFSPYTLQNYGGPALAKDKAVKNYTEIVTNYDLGTASPMIDSSRVEFNEYGQIQSVVSNDFGQITYSYDSSGHLTDISDRESYKAEYNKDGDLVKETMYMDYDGGPMTVERSYKYDSIGNIVEYSEPIIAVSFEYEYDDEGRLLRRHIYDVGYHAIEYYNDNGVISSSEDYGLDGMTDKETLSSTTIYEYEYDSYGNWIKKKVLHKNAGRRKAKLVTEVERRIEYFDDSTVAGSESNTASVSSADSGFVGRYINDLTYRWQRFGYSNGASDVMLIILLIITVAVAAGGMWWLIDTDRFPGFTGRRDSNGMKRLWMYNWQPYASAGLIECDILGAFIVSILAMLIVGGVVWCLFGLVKLLLMAVLIVGWILLVIGILGLLAKEGFGCLGLVVGGLIVANERWINETGDKFVAWGNNFMSTVNMLGFGYNFIISFWDVILIVALIPLVIFLAIAALFIIFSLLLTGIEWIVTKFYSIRRPCPECGNTGRFEYMINGRPHPVALRPGFYGVLHQTRYLPYNTNAQYRVPTMLANGRGRIDRRCASCGAMISATGQHAVGTDVHIGFVGHVEAGKSYLIYGGLGALMQKYPDKIEQINSGNDNSLDISARSNQIAMNRSFKTDKRSSYRAVEVMIDVPNRPVPYHLHVYDVAGEQFAGSSATSATDTAAMKFYTNVKSVVLVIDPLQLDLTAPGMNPSAEFERWQSEHNRSSRRYNIADIFSSLEGYLNHYGRSGSLKDIDVSIVVVKSDLGFFEALNYPAVPSEGDVESFVNQALGLQSLVNTARKFRSVSFFATSAVAPDKSSLTSFFTSLLQQRGINLGNK